MARFSCAASSLSTGRGRRGWRRGWRAVGWMLDRSRQQLSAGRREVLHCAPPALTVPLAGEARLRLVQLVRAIRTAIRSSIDRKNRGNRRLCSKSSSYKKIAAGVQSPLIFCGGGSICSAYYWRAHAYDGEPVFVAIPVEHVNAAHRHQHWLRIVRPTTFRRLVPRCSTLPDNRFTTTTPCARINAHRICSMRRTRRWPGVRRHLDAAHDHPAGLQPWSAWGVRSPTTPPEVARLPPYGSRVP